MRVVAEWMTLPYEALPEGKDRNRCCEVLKDDGRVIGTVIINVDNVTLDDARNSSSVTPIDVWRRQDSMFVLSTLEFLDA